MELLLVVFIFIAVVLLVEGVFLLSRSWWNPETRRVKTQLRQLSAEAYGQGDVDLVRRRVMSEIPWFNRFLLGVRIPVIDRIERMVLQANLNYPVGVILLASVVFAVLGFAAASFATRWFPGLAGRGAPARGRFPSCMSISRSRRGSTDSKSSSPRRWTCWPGPSRRATPSRGGCRWWGRNSATR